MEENQQWKALPSDEDVVFRYSGFRIAGGSKVVLDFRFDEERFSESNHIPYGMPIKVTLGELEKSVFTCLLAYHYWPIGVARRYGGQYFKSSDQLSLEITELSDRLLGMMCASFSASTYLSFAEDPVSSQYHAILNT